jgi:hypothetical protein
VAEVAAVMVGQPAILVELEILVVLEEVQVGLM